MMTQRYKLRTRVCVTLTITITCVLGVLTFVPAATQAAPADLPPRPTPQPTAVSDLPGRPTSPPANSRSRRPTGGFITLRVPLGAPWASTDAPWQELWTVVQWEDRAGNWHHVEGWQGTLDEVSDGQGRKVWWVADDDLGTGPFRWMVYQRRDGRLLIRSESFHLPHRVGEVVVVEVPSVQ